MTYPHRNGYGGGWSMRSGTLGSIHSGRVGPASPRHGGVSWVASTLRSPVEASLHLLALQLKPRLSGLSAGASTLVFWF